MDGLTDKPEFQSTRSSVGDDLKMNLSTVKWAQRDKTQSRELLCVCIAFVHNCCAQYCTEQT